MSPTDRPKRPKDADLLEWVEGVADAGSAGRVARAVTGDPELRAELEAIAADRSAIRALLREDGAEADAPVPSDLIERIELSLERDALLGADPSPEPMSHFERGFDRQGRGRHRRGLGKRRSERWAAPLIAAGVLLAAGGLLLWQPFSPTSQSPGRTSGPELAMATPGAGLEGAADGSRDRTAAPDAAPEAATARADVELDGLADELEALLAQAPPLEPPVTALARTAEDRSTKPVRVSPARAAELAALGRLALVVTTPRTVSARMSISNAADRVLNVRSIPGLELRADLPDSAMAALPTALHPSTPGVLAPTEVAETTDALAGRDPDAPVLGPVTDLWGLELPTFDVPGRRGFVAELRAEPRAVGSLRVWLLGQTNARVEFVELDEPLGLTARPEPGAAMQKAEPSAAPRVAIPILVVRPE